MITKEDYELMKKLVKSHEKGFYPDLKQPYIVTYSVNIHREYNPHFGDDKECKCGHPYYRHFDSYDRMETCGCKYCGCNYFELSDSEIREEKLNQLI